MPETFVLIPGAWHGGWAWRPVAECLRALGHRALTLTLPGLADGADPTKHSLPDTIDHVVDVIINENVKNATLVGHSWAGYVITGAAPRLTERLHKIIYCSAFVPEAGKALIDEISDEHRAIWKAIASESKDNTIAMPYGIWQHYFMQDAPAVAQKMIHQLLVPQPFQYFTEAVEPIDPGKLQVSLSYVLSSEDLAMPSGEYGWQRFARRLGVEPIAAPGGHEALLRNRN